MKVLTVYARLYAECLKQAFASIGRNAWTLLLPIAVLVALDQAAVLLGPLGMLGGFLVGVVVAAAASCYLYFLGEVVAKAKVRLDEFGRAIGAYFWSVANVLFVVWIAELVLSLFGGALPQGPALKAAIVYAAVVLLNATPEVIYQRGTYGGLETIQRAVQFLQANWIEWGVPNLVLLGLLWWLEGQQPNAAVLGGRFGIIALEAFTGALFHLIMVFRGHLFAALDGSSHRQRMYRFRTGTAA